MLSDSLSVHLIVSNFKFSPSHFSESNFLWSTSQILLQVHEVFIGCLIDAQNKIQIRWLMLHRNLFCFLFNLLSSSFCFQTPRLLMLCEKENYKCFPFLDWTIKSQLVNILKRYHFQHEFVTFVDFVSAIRILHRLGLLFSKGWKDHMNLEVGRIC